MKIWKRNAVVAAIVLFVCVAVYLNWSYDQNSAAADGDGTSTAENTLGDAALVSAEDTLKLQSESDSASSGVEGEDGAETLVEDPLTEADLSSATYFDTARLNREEARDSALAILQETVDDPDAAADAVTLAQESISAMASATLAESQIESLVTAKGYADCVAFIGENSVSVVVSKLDGDLEASDIARITDIVCGETDCAASDVKVISAE